MAERLILIVDDEKPIVDILKFNLQKEGFDTIEAYDGQTGLQLALEKNPDLILLDVMLPEMDGFTVCKEIRVKSQVPIILLTAWDEE
ncbi:MAG: response regulator, partial [Clostridia bacterium]|nr:response regulator [Clostridia bacterium]